MNEDYGDYFKVNRKVNVTTILLVLIVAVIGIGYFLFKDEINTYDKLKEVLDSKTKEVEE